MNNEKNLPERKSVRWDKFDYNSIGAYFITICTKDKRQILSRIVGGDVLDAPPSVNLLPFGEIADKYINQLSNFYENIKVDRYVVMPNHIHIMLFVLSGAASPHTTRQHSAVSSFVSTFKRFCNKEYGNNVWQRHFHDHIIRNREDYEKHAIYIYENPINWHYDELFSQE